MQPAIYILASKPNGTLYTGVTSDLIKRIWQHKNNQADGFTQRYNVHDLVYYELHPATMLDAITREKQIKAGSRARKIKLIETMNPEWADLRKHPVIRLAMKHPVKRSRQSSPNPGSPRPTASR